MQRRLGCRVAPPPKPHPSTEQRAEPYSASRAGGADGPPKGSPHVCRTRMPQHRRLPPGQMPSPRRDNPNRRIVAAAPGSQPPQAALPDHPHARAWRHPETVGACGGTHPSRSEWLQLVLAPRGNSAGSDVTVESLPETGRVTELTTGNGHSVRSEQQYLHGLRLEHDNASTRAAAQPPGAQISRAEISSPLSGSLGSVTRSTHPPVDLPAADECVSPEGVQRSQFSVSCRQILMQSAHSWLGRRHALPL